jgi:uncharacterized protein YkuJ
MKFIKIPVLYANEFEINAVVLCEVRFQDRVHSFSHPDLAAGKYHIFINLC